MRLRQQSVVADVLACSQRALKVGPDDLLRFFTLRADELVVLDGVRDGTLHAPVQPDGTITPEAPAPKTALDELADAAKDAEQDNS